MKIDWCTPRALLIALVGIAAALVWLFALAESFEARTGHSLSLMLLFLIIAGLFGLMPMLPKYLALKKWGYRNLPLASRFPKIFIATNAILYPLSIVAMFRLIEIMFPAYFTCGAGPFGHPGAINEVPLVDWLPHLALAGIAGGILLSIGEAFIYGVALGHAKFDFRAARFTVIVNFLIWGSWISFLYFNFWDSSPNIKY